MGLRQAALVSAYLTLVGTLRACADADATRLTLLRLPKPFQRQLCTNASVRAAEALTVAAGVPVVVCTSPELHGSLSVLLHNFVGCSRIRVSGPGFEAPTMECSCRVSWLSALPAPLQV